mgnify:CR=1 FL=1
MKYKVLIIVIVIAVLVVLFSYMGGVRGYSNGHILMSQNYCEDYCPPEIYDKSWETIYSGVDSEDECTAIGGRVIKSFAFGDIYRGCAVKYK